jgi:hypothetical protein
MSGRCRSVFTWSWALLALCLVACGGRSQHGLASDEPLALPPERAQGGGGGTGGTAGSGGNASSGGASSGGSGGSASSGGASSSGTGGIPPVTADDPGACVPDVVRISIGGNTSTRPVPIGACVHLTEYYCTGEGYTIDEGPCLGSCTCLGDGSWECDFPNAPSRGSCEVKQCVRGEEIWDVGSSGIEPDGCTICKCTTHGLHCDSNWCERIARCAELEDEYRLALTEASTCDPSSAEPQCTERAKASLACGGDVPVARTEALLMLEDLYGVNACLPSYRECPHVVPVGHRTGCTPAGQCADAL